MQLSVCLLKKLHPALVFVLSKELRTLIPWNEIVNDDVNWKAVLVHSDAVNAFLVDLMLLEQLLDALRTNSRLSHSCQKPAVTNPSLMNVLRVDTVKQLVVVAAYIRNALPLSFSVLFFIPGLLIVDTKK